jgi:glutathione synthase/RimK-type ligase-like ATP-grasp enzyme
MINIKLIGKKGSSACKEIRSGAKILSYKGESKTEINALINYGLPKPNLDAFFRRFPSARKLPIINRHVGHSKYNVCLRADKNKIPVPKSKLSLDKKDDISEWIEKRINSIGGKGICLARGKKLISGKYYQKFIDKRKYELRIHAFMWIPKEQWRVQKRLGSADEIAWNYKNGGHFVSVYNPKSYKTFIQAMDISEEILKMLGMSFGAVDFLVDRSNNVYFIEINSAPGFTELSKPIYIDAFLKLKSLSHKELLKFIK